MGLAKKLAVSVATAYLTLWGLTGSLGVAETSAHLERVSRRHDVVGVPLPLLIVYEVGEASPRRYTYVWHPGELSSRASGGGPSF